MRVLTKIGAHRRRFRFAVSALAAVAVSVPAMNVFTASAASANASGCTWAPGGAFAQICTNVYGSGTYVSDAYSTYYSSPTTPLGANVCDRLHKFAYYSTDGVRHEVRVDASGCIPNSVATVTGDYVHTTPARHFANNKPFCSAANNSETAYKWTPWACVTIHS
jgi:hypothetical protein